jgi:hypothetical protein
MYINVAWLPTQNHTQMAVFTAITWQNEAGRPSSDLVSLGQVKINVTHLKEEGGEKTRIYSNPWSTPSGLFLEQWKHGSGWNAIQFCEPGSFRGNCMQWSPTERSTMSIWNKFQRFDAFSCLRYQELMSYYSNLITTYGPESLTSFKCKSVINSAWPFSPPADLHSDKEHQYFMKRPLGGRHDWSKCWLEILCF